MGPFLPGTKIVSIRKKTTDFFALSSPDHRVFIVAIDGSNVNVTLAVSDIYPSVIVDNGNFIVGCHDAKKYTTRTISPEGVLIDVQVYNITKDLSSPLQLGYGVLYTSKPTFCSFLFNGTSLYCNPGRSSMIVPKHGSFVVALWQETSPYELVSWLSTADWSLSRITESDTRYNDIKNAELVFFLVSVQGIGSFAILEEDRTIHSFSIAEPVYTGAQFIAPFRISKTSVGAMYCFQTNLGCFIDLFDILSINMMDGWFVSQIRLLGNAPPYFSGPLLHNIQSFPGFTWQKNGQMLYLSKV